MTTEAHGLDSPSLIGDLLRCPITWATQCPDDELCKWLNYAWHKTVRRHQRDRESDLFSTQDWTPSIFALGMMDPDELRSTRINIESWREAATKAYEQQYRGLRDLRVLGPSDYSKHYCPTVMTDEEVAALSVQKREAILYPRITVEWQRVETWATLLDLWITHGRDTIDHDELSGSDVIVSFESMFVRKGLTVAREFCEPIGCSAGQRSVYGLVKYDLTCAQVHMHPVSENEARDHEYFVSGWLRH